MSLICGEVSVLKSNRKRWVHRTLTFSKDPALPWLYPLTADPQAKVEAVLIALDAHAPTEGDKRQNLWPAQIAKVVRLLASHPRLALHSYAERWKAIEDAPLLLFTWMTRAQIVARRPDLVFTLAPSVRFLLPAEVVGAEIFVPQTPRASESELSRYFLADLSTDLAHQHRLGNLVGPLITAAHLKLDVAETVFPAISDQTLAGIFFQKEISSRTDKPSSQPIDQTMAGIRNRLALQSSRSVYIFDDDMESWKPVWNGILKDEHGNLRWKDGLHEGGSPIMRALQSNTFDSQAKRQLERIAGDASLIVVDLRLIPQDHRDTRPVDELSGLKLIEAIARLAPPSRLVPLLAFTSSRQFQSERLAYAYGADMFVNKATRFDQSLDTWRLVTTLEGYLHPAYTMVRYCVDRVLRLRPSSNPQRGGAKEIGREERAYSEEFTRTCNDTYGVLEACRNSLGGYLLHGGARQSGKLKRSSDTCREVGIIFERLKIDHPIWSAIRQLRNLVLHPGKEVKLPDMEHFPYLGLATVAAAVKVLQIGRPNGRSMDKRAYRERLMTAAEWAGMRTGRKPDSNLAVREIDRAGATLQAIRTLQRGVEDLLGEEEFWPGEFSTETRAALGTLERTCVKAIQAELRTHRVGAPHAWIETINGQLIDGARSIPGSI